MVIKEFLPNPVGKDTAGEYIALFNDGKGAVALTGWKLTNSSGKVFRLNSYTLAPSGSVELPYSATKLALKNTGETVSLYNEKSIRIDSLSYRGTAVEGRVVGRSVGLTAGTESKFFANLPENYPTNTRETFYVSPVVFMVLAAVVLAGAAVWVMRQTIDNKQ